MNGWPALLVTAALVAANAFFVASEFAIVKIRPLRLETLANSGSRRARVALGISGKLDAYLSANQLGITLASLGLGWIGEEAFAGLFEPLFHRFGGIAAARSLAITVSFILITFLHTVLGELAPKSLAIQRTEPVALWTAPPLRGFYVAMYPVIWILNAASQLTLRILGLHPVSEAERLHSPDELRMLLPHVAMDVGARRLIDRVFDYTHRLARHVMTLRRDVVLIPADATFEDSIAFMLQNQYTRYPVLDETMDEVVGYVHIKDVMAALAAGERPRMRDLVRKPIYVREDTVLELLRREFQRRRVHLAVVLDEKGIFSGVVTLEDLLEEVVGEILDEQDAGELAPWTRSPDGSFEADGRLTIDVAKRDLGLQLDPVPDGIETIGGYIAARLQRMPRPGDRVDTPGVRLEVIDVRERRVWRVRGVPSCSS